MEQTINTLKIDNLELKGQGSLFKQKYEEMIVLQKDIEKQLNDVLEDREHLE